jgi:hypothetical protein
MSDSDNDERAQQREELRKRAVRQRAKQFIQEDKTRQFRRGQNDRLVKAKAAELRVREEIKAERRREKRRQQIANIVLREDSDEDSDGGSEEDIKTSQGRDWNTCLSLSCFVILVLVCNLLLFQYLLTTSFDSEC